MQIDHVTIRTRDIAAARDFFHTVFDLQQGNRPAAIQRIPGCWLYSEGRPLVHIIGSRGGGFDHAAEAIDHVGLRMTDYTGFRSKLDRLGIRYSAMDLADIQERRLFLHAPVVRCWRRFFPNPFPNYRLNNHQSDRGLHDDQYFTVRSCRTRRH